MRSNEEAVSPDTIRAAVTIRSADDVVEACGHLQIVDARPKSDFDAGHIPGAIWMGWEAWCDSAPAPEGSIVREKGYWGALRQAPASWYAERLAACGLRRRDPIVVYSDGPPSRGREGRCAWMLLYLGAVAVSLLDGGWGAWLEIGGRVERESRSPPPGDFPVSFQAERRRTVAELAERWESQARPLLVDTRSPAEYAGDGQHYLPRRGHIPGAILVPFTSLFDARGQYLDRAGYLEMLPWEVRQGGDVVAYCEVGVRASLFALLHEAYTGRVIPVCDGSLVEWVLTSELPLQARIPL